VTKRSGHLKPGAYKALFEGIVALPEESRLGAGRAINSIITSACWEVGRRIVEENSAREARRIRTTNWSSSWACLKRELKPDTHPINRNACSCSSGFAFSIGLYR
jgi:hypothetical protein